MVVSLLLASFASSASAQSWMYFPYFPLFQFNIFYNVNLEIDPGAPLNINGPVFCNQGIWAGTDNAAFNSTVTAAGLVYDADTDPTNHDPWASAKTDIGTPSGNFLYPPAFDQPQLNLPIENTVTNPNPNAVESIINLPPSNIGAPNPNAYTTNGSVYFFNKCDLIISNSANGLNGTGGSYLTIWYQDPSGLSPGFLNQISNDFYALKLAGPTGSSTNIVSMNIGAGIDCYTNVAYAGFSFATNVSYYDYRERDTVQAVQVDVGKLNTWLNNNATTGGYQYNKTSFYHNGDGINSIFIYNNVPKTGSQLPAVRLINGAQLPYTVDPNGYGRTTGGLTVATPQPIYVYGNYNVQTSGGTNMASFGTTNTASTYPAALMCDAITVLSSKWNDAYTSATGIGSRVPTNTTINAACLEGIVQSTNSNYSGGVENFLRLEENWTTFTLTYNGSIVVLFPCIYATNFWPGTGGVYNAPKRNWSFDLNFTLVTKLPALTPLAFYNTNYPVIITQPLNQTNLQGSIVTFSVAVISPTSWNYQWNFNGTNISGATSASLTLTNVQPNQAGNYAVLVSTPFFSTLSSNAVLSVYVTASPTLNSPVVSGGNQIQFYIAGVPGFKYGVQGSSNLIDWVSLFTNISPFTFTDTNAPNLQQRFYRSVYLP